ncbi:23S rRNA (uracil(1939)-C(5))-methyltransferase RlmD [Liquorilactobacillus capillatus]|uniref:tRNA (Uracil-5-)-methyltransferase n=1 Tax=Liquorilactobacillus capillatus DSM 19910 TaxID=1423731 RepID=A0A0R1LX77_9LACO|nr:23S rRNA (uracil(1939)-C(5))-methyltransferase RlmD [Liquorilactobacillus capillatus]KRL00263.1 tRNA (Uracil-5-) -methyltransferase [Liquorilactobacillus capillatus DSM 19910]
MVADYRDKNKQLIKVGQCFPLTIKRLGINGEGIGYYKHKVIFVAGALVQEVIVAEIISVRPNYATAKIHRIRKRSQDRIEKKDQYDVGGIELEHLRYTQQLEFKRDVIRQSLEKFKPTGYKTYKLLPTIGMQTPFEYRNKAQFQVRKNQQGQVIAGLYRRNSHDLVALPTFSTQRPLTMQIMRTVCEILQELEIPIYDEKKNSGIIKTLVVRESWAEKNAQLTFITNSTKLPHKKQLLEKVASRLPMIVSVMQNINQGRASLVWGDKTLCLAGKDYLLEKLGNIQFKLSAQAFFQLNPEQTEKMYLEIKKALALKKDELLIDAYCGAGTIGLFVAEQAKEVRGMDIVAAAIADARFNARLNGYTNTQYVTGKAEEVIPKWVEEGLVPHALVVDPPRTGLDKRLIKTILEVKPTKFVYVSCNPSTLARDLVQLTRVYRVDYIQSIDMFPQTARCEAVVKLIRKK